MQPLNARPPFFLRTLGELSLVGPAGAPIPFHHKELLLLAYLARRDGGTASRAELAALLWGDRGDGLARVSLRQAIFRLRGALGDAITGDGETVGIEPSRLRVDASEFERFSGAGELEAAIAAWTGDFLAGDDPPGNEAFRDWAADERDMLHRRYVRLREQLTEQAVAAGRWGDAVVPTIRRQFASLPEVAGDEWAITRFRPASARPTRVASRSTRAPRPRLARPCRPCPRLARP